MKLLDYRLQADQPVERYGSVGATFGRIALLAGSGQVGCIRLEPGAVLGRHPAPVPQLFCVIDGEGYVSGADGTAHAIVAGQAALWEAEESHESVTETGMTVIVVELASIQATARRT
jgi:hypothetical protein